MPHVADLRDAWKKYVDESPNLATQARAALAELESPLHASYAAARETAWTRVHLYGVQLVMGTDPAGDEGATCTVAPTNAA